MTLDLVSHYYPPYEPGSFGLVTIWRRKSNVPDHLPSQVAVKEVFRTSCFRLKGTVIVEDDEETLLSLQHQNIVKIYQITRTQGGLSLIVMEKCAGTLDKYTEIHPCSIDDLRFMGLQILSGLRYLHQRRIVHRDIKPSNILVNSFDTTIDKESVLILKIADFGSSKQMNDFQQTATIRGSPKYMAPEIVKAFKSQENITCYNGEKVDIFSTGLTFYKMLNGCIPFTFDDRCKDYFDHIRFLRQCDIDDENCISLLSNMLSWNATERCSAQQLLQHVFFTKVLEKTNGMEKSPGIYFDDTDDCYDETDNEYSDADAEEYDATTAAAGGGGHKRKNVASTSHLTNQRPTSGTLPLPELVVKNVTERMSQSSEHVKPVSSLVQDPNGPPLCAYEKEAKLGQGSLGHVDLYKLRACYDRNNISKDYPGHMAVKTIMTNEISSLRELDISLKLQHDNIVRIYGVEEDTDLTYIKMELAKCDLKTLKDNMRTGNEQFLPSDVGYFAYQIVSGLCYLHEKLIAHRDIKPSNVLALWESVNSSSPQVHSIILKLCDFGLSRYVPRYDDTSLTVVGSLSYMAPEVSSELLSLKFHGDYRKADIFSAGVVIFELWKGQRPFAGDNHILIDDNNDAPVLLEWVVNEEAKSPFLRIVLQAMLQWHSWKRCDAYEARKMLYSFFIRPRAANEEQGETFCDKSMNATNEVIQEGKLPKSSAANSILHGRNLPVNAGERDALLVAHAADKSAAGLPPEPGYSNLDLICSLVSIVTYSFNLCNDILAALYLYLLGVSHGIHNYCLYFGLTVAFVLLTSLAMTNLSRPRPLPLLRSIIRMLLSMLQLDPLLHHFSAMLYGMNVRLAGRGADMTKWKGHYSAMVRENAEASLLWLFKSFLQTAPQLVLQIYVLINDARSIHINDKSVFGVAFKAVTFNAAFIVASLMSLAWSLFVFQRSIRYKTSSAGRLVQFLWQFACVFARVSALSLFATAFPTWIFPVCFAHWLVMLAWVAWYGTRQMASCITICEEFLHWQILAAVYLFSFFDFMREDSSHQHLLYYKFCFLENTALLVAWFVQCWQSFTDHNPPWYAVAGLVGHYAAFFTGVAAMYVFFSRFRPPPIDSGGVSKALTRLAWRRL